MAKYGLIIAAVFTALVMTSSCKLNTSVGSLVCSPAQSVAEKQLVSANGKEFVAEKSSGKARREPLLLLRILTEF